MERAYYNSSIEDFVSLGAEGILGIIAKNNTFDLTITQREAWLKQTEILKNSISNLSGKVYFEFSIPRMGKRVDIVLIIESVIFIIEFKVGAKSYDAIDLMQVTDYALDMHNFHEGSHAVTLVPILVATEAPPIKAQTISLPDDGLLNPIKCNSQNMGSYIANVLSLKKQPFIDTARWENSGYKPTPTIIEATLALYNGHSVAEISRSDAAVENISLTSKTIDNIIKKSRQNSDKSIIFVTGVPGAGKTLVGLNAATSHIDASDELYSVFLSGNGPLVRILQEALARDKVARAKELKQRILKSSALSEVKAFIQNVHHFRDDCLIDLNRAPAEHVALFDEAQRAWSKAQTVKFMRSKKNQPDFNMSEPEFLISCMDRHKDWAAIVCLVGGGQEINTGEAGIKEWFEAIEEHFPDWKIYLSESLTDNEYGAGEIISRARKNNNVSFINNLHLQTSVRSFRSEKVSLFVKQLLDLELEKAKESYKLIKENYPIVLTRDLEKAKNWVRHKSRGSERYGMIVSSQASRLKPYAIDVRVKPDPVHWFLNSKQDVRSSYYLEDVATEFDVQGLELDWVCMAWDADFRLIGEQWENWSFKGSKWQRINIEQNKIYQKNTYRVLLTRARQGMVLFVPEGNKHDKTRPPNYYDTTFNYLKNLGLKEL
ncbi:MAG: DUF2075 domain-containing protein [Gammaproteobacteria bacterium]|nr:DUF2075 domain-containing protein [Gammaproteobacteria bacterium]